MLSRRCLAQTTATLALTLAGMVATVMVPSVASAATAHHHAGKVAPHGTSWTHAKPGGTAWTHTQPGGTAWTHVTPNGTSWTGTAWT